MSEKKLAVLIVEDNPGDAFMIKEMLLDLKLELEMTVKKDGQEALNLLKDLQNGIPDLVILDLNLPKVNGFDVLAFIKASPSLNSIPVVVMTGSLRKEDETRARELGATDYISKPSTVEEMERSEGRLRARLEPLSREKGNGGCSDLSVKGLLENVHIDGVGRRGLSAMRMDSWTAPSRKGPGVRGVWPINLVIRPDSNIFDIELPGFDRSI